VVPNGQTGTLNADARCDLYGTLSGYGTLNFRVPWVRTTLFTDWSDFAGTINVTTDADGGDLRMATDYNFPGFPLARVHLSAKVTAYFAGTLAQGAGTGIEIGELSGDVSSKLMGGSAASGARALTYYIGGRGNDATFAGTIAEQDSAITRTSFVKRGTGVWTLAGSCSWNGGTTVEAGTLRVGGSLTSNGGNFAVLSGATLDLTGGTVVTADLKVETGGRLTGSGTITGDFANQGTVTCGSGALTITGDVVNNGTMRLTGGATLNASGRFVNNGILDLLTAAASLPANLENNGVIIDSSSLSRAQVAKTGNAVTISVQTFSGHTYQLQRSDSLTLPAWVNLGTAQAGDGSVRAFTDPAASSAQRFYRVLVAP
jgi:autotransporter-associated beta strand protein